jgi:hypothetical protein
LKTKHGLVLFFKTWKEKETTVDHTADKTLWGPPPLLKEAQPSLSPPLYNKENKKNHSLSPCRPPFGLRPSASPRRNSSGNPHHLQSSTFSFTPQPRPTDRGGEVRSDCVPLPFPLPTPGVVRTVWSVSFGFLLGVLDSAWGLGFLVTSGSIWCLGVWVSEDAVCGFGGCVGFGVGDSRRSWGLVWLCCRSCPFDAWVCDH